MTAQKKSAAGEPAPTPVQPLPNPRRRILVVEDEVSLRQINIEVLTCSGYQVDAAEDGAAAWDALQLKNYDLLVTDNDMPKVTGVELIQKLQAARMALPVIMATGAPPHEEFTRHRLPPPAKILLKPYTFDELLEAVKTVLFTSNGGGGENMPPSNWRTQTVDNRIQP